MNQTYHMCRLSYSTVSSNNNDTSTSQYHAVLKYQPLSFHDYALLKLFQMLNAAAQKKICFPLVAESTIK